MHESAELRLSNYLIENATARLVRQHDTVRRLKPDAAPGLARIAHRTLAALEGRLASLLVEHQSLLKQQSGKDERRFSAWLRREPGPASWWRLDTAVPNNKIPPKRDSARES